MRPPTASAAVRRHERTAAGAGGAHDEQRRRVDVARRVALARVVGAGHQRVELDVGLRQRVERAYGRHERARGSRCPHGVRVARREIDGVDAVAARPTAADRSHAARSARPSP